MALEEELQKMYDSEIHVEIGWLWDGGIEVSIGNGEVSENVQTVAEVLPWLQQANRQALPEFEIQHRASCIEGDRLMLILFSFLAAYSRPYSFLRISD